VRSLALSSLVCGSLCLMLAESAIAQPTARSNSANCAVGSSSNDDGSPCLQNPGQSNSGTGASCPPANDSDSCSRRFIRAFARNFGESLHIAVNGSTSHPGNPIYSNASASGSATAETNTYFQASVAGFPAGEPVIMTIGASVEGSSSCNQSGQAGRSACNASIQFQATIFGAGGFSGSESVTNGTYGNVMADGPRTTFVQVQNGGSYRLRMFLSASGGASALSAATATSGTFSAEFSHTLRWDGVLAARTLAGQEIDPSTIHMYDQHGYDWAHPLRCGNADFNGDGDLGTDSDIEAFFACLGGDCCFSCYSADFNGDGDLGTDADIESFFVVLGGGAC
jgi:hypothetical protein